MFCTAILLTIASVFAVGFLPQTAGVRLGEAALRWLADFVFLFACIRRLHDIGKTGWLVLFFPIANFVFLIWFFGRRGTDGPNRYGSAPSGPLAAP